ncbi:MAG: hypothetical protein DMF51_02025 [Acidobacteria bacterium]|nr:MAG: hypothetical protein DMF51_02025 [Acidobacteriota bacterium]
MAWLVAAAAPAAPVPARPDAAPPAAARLTPAELRSSLEKADKALRQTERLVRGTDPGRVSLLLARADEELTRFQEGSGLLALERAFEEARRAARASDWTAAGAAVRRARDLMGAVSDLTVLRQTEEASRAAQRAADSMDGPMFMESLDRFEAAVLAPVLLARLRETREAISRARLAMVHRNMQEGRAQILAARHGLGGLEYAGALSRASFSLSIGAELLASDSVIAGRDQVLKASRELRRAVEVAPDDTRAALEEARVQAGAIWKRSGRASKEAGSQLAELAKKVETIRRQQRA